MLELLRPSKLPQNLWSKTLRRDHQLGREETQGQ